MNEEPKSLAGPAHQMTAAEREAVAVCSKLRRGELKPSELGSTPETSGYSFLRDEFPRWMEDEKWDALAKKFCYGPKHNPALIKFAYITGWHIDGSWGQERGEDVYKLLFSDKTNTRYFSAGVENGHFIRDGAAQFHEYLVAKYGQEEDSSLEMTGKSLENELVEYCL
mmetsp:Transcript_61341/g.146099  ORF Transcript_61341/g.146099 Transcript_61341/m.146099 type:complete len:168 (+) Transcript_61341:168-671(+)